MKKELKKLLWVGLAAVVIIGGGILAYNAALPQNIPAADPNLLVKKDSHSTEQGTRNYTITIVEFGDYQCPACGYVEPMIEKLLAEYPQAKLVFRNFPLPGHQNAMIAAEAAEAAGAQGKFWEMHNAIYLNQEIWSKMETPMDAFVEMAKKLNLDLEKFKQDVQNHAHVERINKDRDDGVALGVNSTPTFYINGRKYLGGNSYVTLKLAIDEALQTQATQQVTK